MIATYIQESSWAAARNLFPPPQKKAAHLRGLWERFVARARAKTARGEIRCLSAGDDLRGHRGHYGHGLRARDHLRDGLPVRHWAGFPLRRDAPPRG